jgi:hypothetical protein
MAAMAGVDKGAFTDKFFPRWANCGAGRALAHAVDRAHRADAARAAFGTARARLVRFDDKAVSAEQALPFAAKYVRLRCAGPGAAARAAALRRCAALAPDFHMNVTALQYRASKMLV